MTDQRAGASGVGRRDLAIGLPACAIGGLLVGVLGTFKHRVGISAATGTGLPIGLVLGLAMIALFLVALRLTFPSRWFVAAAALGVVVACEVLALPGRGGGRVVLLDVPGVVDVVGIVWLVAPAVVAVLVVAWPRRRGRQRGDGILDASAPSNEDRTPL